LLFNVQLTFKTAFRCIACRFSWYLRWQCSLTFPTHKSNMTVLTLLLVRICSFPIQNILHITFLQLGGFANASDASTSTQYSGECTIQNALYPNEFLSMKSGWVYKYAVLAYGNPKSTKGNWNWRSIWRLTPVVSEGQQAIILRDHKTNK
jgi:hypothetical protein